MRMLIHIKIPNCQFNTFVKDGSIGKKIKTILNELKPEAVYFTEYHGCRGLIMLADVAQPSDVPHFAEPWFVMFDAQVEFHIVMSPAELERAGIESMAKSWV